MELVAVEKILGGKKILHKQIKNRMDLIELSKIGISKNALSLKQIRNCQKGGIHE